MKEEILRRRDVFKGFLEKELYQNIEHESHTRSVVNNVMTVYDSDIKTLLEASKKDVMEMVEKVKNNKIVNFSVVKYFDDMYEKTIARGLSREEAKQIRDKATGEYGHDYTSYEIREE